MIFTVYMVLFNSKVRNLFPKLYAHQTFMQWHIIAKKINPDLNTFGIRVYFFLKDAANVCVCFILSAMVHYIKDCIDLYLLVSPQSRQHDEVMQSIVHRCLVSP